MSFFVRTASGRSRTIFARVLAFVLLAGLFQAITFGSVHSHVNPLSVHEAGQFVDNSGQAEYAVPDPFHYQTQRQECLICLFHQQLFNSVVHTPFYVADQALPETGSKADKLLHYSASFTSSPIVRLTGRAPPRS